MEKILNYIKRNEKIVVFYICSLFAVLLTGLFLLKYCSLGLKTYDQGAYWYVIENFMRHGSFYERTMEFSHHLGVHFNPILSFYSLFQFLSPGSPFIMLGIYAIILSFTPYLMYKIAAHYFTQQKDSLKLILCAFSGLAYFPFLVTSSYDFSPERMAPVFLLALYYFAILKKNHSKALLFAVILCLTRETLSLGIAGLGLYFIFFEKNYKAGFIYCFMGLLVFLLTVIVLMPYLREHSPNLIFKGAGAAFTKSHYAYIAGASAKETFLNVLSSPVKVLKVFFFSPFLKWIKFIGLSAFLFFLPFFKIRYLILTFFSVCIYYLSPDSSIFYYKSQYFNEIFPAFLFAFPAGLHAFLKRKDSNFIFAFCRKHALKIMSLSFMAILLLFYSLYYHKMIRLKLRHQAVITKINSDPLHLKEKKNIAVYVHNRLFYQWGWHKNLSLINKFNLSYPLYKKESKKIYLISYNHKDYGDWNSKVFKNILPTLLKEGFKKVYEYKTFYIYEKVFNK